MKDTVYNHRLIGNFLLFLVLFVIAMGGVVRESKDWECFFLFLALALLPLLLCAGMPYAVCFDEKGFTIRYFFGFYETADWESVSDVYREHVNGTLFSENYIICVRGGTTGKKAFFTCGEMNANRKTQKILRQYYREDFER